MRKSLRFPRFSIKSSTIISLTAGALMATLSFSHAAASIGVPIQSFRPLGSNFFAWRSAQAMLITRLGPRGEEANKLPLVKFGQTVLLNAPLSARPIWLIGMGRAAAGDKAGAREAMLLAEHVSRQEPGPQLWLAEDGLRRGDSHGALRHVDVMLRTNTDVATQILPKLAPILTDRRGRDALRPFAKRDNPWFADFLVAASGALRSVVPLAQFITEDPAPPLSGDAVQQAYSNLVKRLAREHAYGDLLKVYPRLPGAKAASLRDLSIQGTGAQNYPPVTWELSDTDDHGATAMSLGNGRQAIEFFASPGTVGTSGTKLLVPGTARRMLFRVTGRSTNPGASARWVATCVSETGDGLATSSANLLTASTNVDLRFDLPGGCQLIRLDLQIAGGTGNDPARVLVERMKLVE